MLEANTDAGRELVAGRRAVRAQRLSVLLAELSPADQDALAAALPAITALARRIRASSRPLRADLPRADLPRADLSSSRPRRARSPRGQNGARA